MELETGNGNTLLDTLILSVNQIVVFTSVPKIRMSLQEHGPVIFLPELSVTATARTSVSTPTLIICQVTCLVLLKSKITAFVLPCFSPFQFPLPYHPIYFDEYAFHLRSYFLKFLCR